MYKVYIASDFTNRMGAKNLARTLHNQGYIVVSSWHSLDPFGDDKGAVGSKERQRWAFIDLAELEQADVLVRLGGNESGRGGQFVELGYALARSKPCFILQHDNVKNIFELVHGAFICSGLADLLTKLSLSGGMQYVLPYPEEIKKQKEEEIMKLQALCVRYAFSEDANKISFTDRGTNEIMYTGDAGVPRDAQISAAYATLLAIEDPAKILEEAGVEVPVEEPVEVPVGFSETFTAPKHAEKISAGGTGVVAGNRFDKSSVVDDDSVAGE